MVISKKEFSPKEKGTCQVCGDQATGTHYQAITCEGCKGFFRRTEQNHLQYTCKSNEHCVVTKETRVKCQRCRYLKCLTVMKPDLVMEPEERMAKQDMIKRNRQRRMVEGFLANPEALGVVPMTDEMSTMIHTLAKHYSECIVPAIGLDEDFQYKDMGEQSEALLMIMLGRCVTFSGAIQKVGEIRANRCFARIDIELLDILYRINLEDRSVTKRPVIVGTRFVYSEEKIKLDSLGFPVEVINELLFLAAIFKGLGLDDQQLALLSAIMLMESDFTTHALKESRPRMAEVFKICETLLGQENKGQEEEVNQGKMYMALISYLETECNFHERRAVYSFPAIMSAMKRLRGFVRSYGDTLVAFPCSLARLLS